MNENTKHIPSVFDMVEEYSEKTGTPVDDIFRKDTAKKPKKVKPAPEEKPSSEKPSEWTPDPELIEDIIDSNDGTDHTTGAVFHKSELMEEPTTVLVNLSDEMARKEATQQSDELQRAYVNIEEAKRRIGVKHLNIPTLFVARVMDCASDTNSERAVTKTVGTLTEIIKQDPAAVLEWLPDHGIWEITGDPKPEEETTGEPITVNVRTAGTATTTPEAGESVQVIIDKRQAPEVVFDDEEREKIRKARSVELKIVEERELKYRILEEPVNNIDVILSQYTKKFNDRSVSLPASKYRCTVTGLSFPEIMDLSYSQELNNLDGERKKWSIAYKHIKNPSIGPFESFEDFLKKTSYLDINYIIWQILCATCMPREIISVDCHIDKCKNHYDWVYSPSELFQIDKADRQVMEEMVTTGKVSSLKDIEDNYNSSMLRLNNTVELTSSGFIVGFGHISAYDYLEHVFAKLEELRDNNTTVMSDAMKITALTAVKYFMIPNTDGTGYYRISKTEDILRVMDTLDEIDFQAINEIVSLVIFPYELTFELKDVVCPKCHTKSSIKIDDVSELLFIIAQSLSNVNVVLKRQ